MRHPRRPLFVLVGCLILLQAADFCLTWRLLASGVRGDVYEANPLANHVLSRFGWLGLAGFKSACSMVALSAVLLVCRHRAAAGARLLVLLCMVMAGVVGYSGALLSAPTDSNDEHLSSLRLEYHQIGSSIAAIREFAAHRSAICRDVLDERIDLPIAVERMRACIARFAPAVRNSNRDAYPDLGDDNGVAAYLFHHASRLHDQHPDFARKFGRIANS